VYSLPALLDVQSEARHSDDVGMGILGHSNISLTMNTYSHVMPEMFRDAAKAMNAVIGA